MKIRIGITSILLVGIGGCGVERDGEPSPRSESTINTARTFQALSPAAQRAPGDYDGDGKTDRTVWRPLAGGSTWFGMKRSGAPRQDVTWGLGGEVPVNGDYDGDGKADRAVWRPSASGSVWFVMNSSGAPRQDVTWGID